MTTTPEDFEERIKQQEKKFFDLQISGSFETYTLALGQVLMAELLLEILKELQSQNQHE